MQIAKWIENGASGWFGDARLGMLAARVSSSLVKNIDSRMRPEDANPPEIFYGESEAKKYTENSRVIAIQESMTMRAVELLKLPNG